MMKILNKTVCTLALLSATLMSTLSPVQAGGMAPAFLQITLDISAENRAAAVAVYQKYRQPFLDQIKGAKAKNLIIRDDDVQVLHKFTSSQTAQAYLGSELFAQDVVRELKPLLNKNPDVRIYSQFNEPETEQPNCL